MKEVQKYCPTCRRITHFHRVEHIDYKCSECGHRRKRKSRQLQGIAMGTWGYER